MSVSEFNSAIDVCQAAYAFTPNDGIIAANGGSGDNGLITGAIIDRTSYGRAKSGVVLVAYVAHLADTETCTLKSVLIEHGDAAALGDATTFATLSTSTVVATGSGSAADYTGVARFAFHAGGCKRYIRVKLTPDLSASGTDTLKIAGIIAFSEAER